MDNLFSGRSDFESHIKAQSLASLLAQLPMEERRALVDQLDADVREYMTHHWRVWARPDQIPPEGDWTLWLFLAGRGSGKLLCDTTPIPTPSGWTTMGELKVGDAVFDEAGVRCRVTAKFSPPVNQAYALKFSDGSEIIADAEHQWVTWTHAARKAYLRSAHELRRPAPPANWPQWSPSRVFGASRVSQEKVETATALAAKGVSARKIEKALKVCRQALRRHLRGEIPNIEPKRATKAQWKRAAVFDNCRPKIRNTEEIVVTLRQGKRRDLNHSIPVCGALNLPEADLPIDPYVLGLWLGDGTSVRGEITAHPRDHEHYREQIELAGYAVRKWKHPNSFNVVGLNRALRKAGFLSNKRVTDQYLRASAWQRIALLRGLMDSDGHVGQRSKRVEFSNCNERLIDAVVEIAVSLGQKPVKSAPRVTTCQTGARGQKSWRVTWSPTINPFSLPRKADIVDAFSGAQQAKHYHRMIVACDPVETRPMSCITVDSPNSMYLCGRAMIPTHNTWTGSNWVNEIAERGDYRTRIALVGATNNDVRDVMILGDSGIVQTASPWNRPKFEPSKRRVEWRNGAQAFAFSAEEPERLRGPQFNYAWCDEVAAWGSLQYTWDMLQFGMRLGNHTRTFLSTTPRPIKFIKDIVARAASGDTSVRLTRGKTSDNRANLSPNFFTQIMKRYEGSSLGAQELNGEILEESEHSLFRRSMIDDNRVPLKDAPKFPEDYKRVCVAVDPPTTFSDDSDEAGIIVAGVAQDDHCYILRDLSAKYKPHEWGAKVIQAYHGWQADRIVGEANNGGDMIEHVIRSLPGGDNVAYRKVYATRGKWLRAEPVSTLYAQGRVHHVGVHEALESQMMAFSGSQNSGPRKGDSPDRLDALVWAVTDLMISGTPHAFW